GEVVITDQIFPDAGSQSLSLCANGGNVDLNELQLFQMHTALPSPKSALTNGDFHTGDLTDWSVTSGTAFGSGAVTNLTTAWTSTVGGDSESFDQNGTYHVWGYLVGGDAPTGVMISQTVKLGGTGLVDFQTGGGNDNANLYIALVRASDGAELF